MIALHHSIPARAQNRASIAEANIRRVISARVREAMADGYTIKGIAAACGLSTSTVSKLYYGETRRPQLHTCLVVLAHFDHDIHV
jgi:AraC-like DNA-binding protein